MLARFSFCLLLSSVVFGQANTGELRLFVTDQSGAPIETAIGLVSEGNQYKRVLESDNHGRVFAKRLPFGLYTLSIDRSGFSTVRQIVDIQSALPKELKIALAVGPVKTTTLEVSSAETLIDPYAISSERRIGGNTITDRLSTPPGRSVAELVNQEPGWMFEANGILHPRAEEYQVQYVIDGMPLTENRSAAYVADFERLECTGNQRNGSRLSG